MDMRRNFHHLGWWLRLIIEWVQTKGGKEGNYSVKGGEMVGGRPGVVLGETLWRHL